eukprot:gene9276-11369_t
MFITFVVDTSVSMGQKTVNGMTLLDCTKAAIEHFIKIRSKDSSIRTDRFFLVTTEEGNFSVKIGWKDHYNSFLQEVKNLTAKDMSNIGFSLQKAFDLLNQFRLQTSIDNYCQGRNPWFIDPSIVILLTDGSALTNTSNIIENFSLPKNPSNVSDPTIEPFRWDQRLFSIVLKFNGIPSASQIGPHTEPIIAPMCEVTGGKCQIATSMKTMIQQVEGLIQKLQSGVVVSFEPIPIPSVQNLPMPSLHKMLYVRTQGGFWPIPENYYPDLSNLNIPPRTAHPIIKYSLVESDPYIPENFPFDKYEVEPCPMTQYLLSNKINCVRTFMMNSQQLSGQGDCFGYLRTNSTGNSVNLFVFPYNYPRLWGLLDELVQQLKLQPTQKWKQEFENYLLSVPPYYINPLRIALKRFCTLNLIPDTLDNQFLNYISNIVKKLKTQSQAKIEAERLLLNSNKQQQQQPKTSTLMSQLSSPSVSLSSIYNPTPSTKNPVTGRNFHQILEIGYDPSNDYSDLIENSIDDSTTTTLELNQDIDPIINFYNPNILHRNVFDIQRHNILGQLDKMRDHIFKKKVVEDDETKHNLPISQMGNYHETLSKRETLRDIDEDKKPNHPLFGNPYRKEKGPKFAMSIDEADETGDEAGVAGGFGGKKGFKRRRIGKFPPPSLKNPATTPPTTPGSPTPPTPPTPPSTTTGTIPPIIGTLQKQPLSPIPGTPPIVPTPTETSAQPNLEEEINNQQQQQTPSPPLTGSSVSANTLINTLLTSSTQLPSPAVSNILKSPPSSINSPRQQNDFMLHRLILKEIRKPTKSMLLKKLTLIIF